jgi:hypothetical protein
MKITLLTFIIAAVCVVNSKAMNMEISSDSEENPFDTPPAFINLNIDLLAVVHAPIAAAHIDAMQQETDEDE